MKNDCAKKNNNNNGGVGFLRCCGVCGLGRAQGCTGEEYGRGLLGRRFAEGAALRCADDLAAFKRCLPTAQSALERNPKDYGNAALHAACKYGPDNPAFVEWIVSTYGGRPPPPAWGRHAAQPLAARPGVAEQRQVHGHARGALLQQAQLHAAADPAGSQDQRAQQARNEAVGWVSLLLVRARSLRNPISRAAAFGETRAAPACC